ncbi:hypothetical protein IT084_15690 [Desulfallas sp. Bu1-1]|uniref:hypothetical protein n=1 Tax=Desulfallas sp. Bu1-1 TaxID=2787620 RepID=UPI0018A0CDF6|nr:hypothetical protein [Desulfallas sp. Bu1-1]MBF7084395.1 hypothetical protein [Desulfallas sp. Bu1-1]
MPTYAVYTGVGKENATLRNLKAAARRCKEIVSAALTPWPGYVRVEVKAGDNAEVKNAVFSMPKNTRMVIELVPGVVKILGNGNETVPLE